MACCPTQKRYGYESSRFEKDVDENFHCSICYNVLKEPRTCRNNDHMFCLACITEHLTVNSQTCPECNDHLSVDTLRRPRVVNNYLSELKINCDYASRGCPEFVRVADLETHVDNCCFAPVTCSNEKCGMEINKQDKVHHETEVCEYRKVNCHECGQIQEVVRRLEQEVAELDRKVEASRHEIGEVKKEMKEARRETKKEVGNVKKEVQYVKENISKVNSDVVKLTIMMGEMLEKLNMLELLKLPSPSEGMTNSPREDILIAGGYEIGIQKSSEIYSWKKKGWFQISEMSERRGGASSFIYKDNLFVIGGERCKTIETMDLNELPLKWMEYPGELPHACDDNKTVVYQQRIIHIGGFSFNIGKVANVISELQLSSPCIMKELCQMPEPRQCHGAEIFEDKILIIGGVMKWDSGVLDSVLEFDVTRNKCKEMPPLPRALMRVETVRWRDKVVVLGGQDEDRKVFNNVFMYDSKTGKITILPSMLKKRSGCCAVITGNTIVVMGGYDDDGKNLKSVECFTMGGSSWEYLPDMNKARSRGIAEVLPYTKKYV